MEIFLRRKIYSHEGKKGDNIIKKKGTAVGDADDEPALKKHDGME